MISSIRAGPPSRPCASFIKLAQRRARRSSPVSRGRQSWRSYATEPSNLELERAQDIKSLASQWLLLIRVMFNSY